MNPLQKLGEHGQSVWLDFISRDLIQSGELQRLVDQSNVTGLTSNPTIFEKAIAEGSDYDAQIRECLADGITDPSEIFLALAISDIQHAADILRPVHERTQGQDGFVSLEVIPSLAHDEDSTVAMATSFWERVQRPNLMVKIPATSEGMPAIRRALSEGVNINVTLIFALESYRNVINAYLDGLEARRGRDQSLDVHSVASFFVSRVDTAVDKLIEEKLKADPGNATLESLLGKAAIANAQLAYEMFEENFRSGARFAALRGDGGCVQRPLWASTSAKNPNYRDVIYAEALIGPDTVDTMPPSTIDAFRDHGIVEGDTVNADYAAAHRVMEQLAEVGIDMEKVTADLLSAGVASFSDSFDQLIRRIAEKVDRMQGGYGGRQHFGLGPSAELVSGQAESDSSRNLVERIWKRDPGVWKPGDATHAAVIGNRLGWLDVIDVMRGELGRLTGLTTEVREAGFRNCVLLGMGGSSLCPEVLRTSFGSAAGQPVLHVLDTTDPAAISAISRQCEPKSTLFIVASKSGGTIETLSHLACFWQWISAAGIADPGSHFIAVTDAGTSLGNTARERRFRHLFENPGDIGGRYSALSFFGLVPAAVLGVDVEQLLDRAARMRGRCRPGTPGDLNCGLQLGTAMGLMQHAGRDKVTILTPPRIAAFSLWAEQLIAESTGKEGKGIIPIGDEPIGEPPVYGDDRLFVALSIGDDQAEFDAEVGALRTAGHPVITLQLEDLYDLGAEFFRWEFATAVAGSMLGIDPFDEPNVAESKENTKRVLAAYEKTGSLAVDEPSVSGDGVAITGSSGDSVDAALHGFLDGVHTGDYVALMAYLTPTAENTDALQRLRVAIRDELRVATTLGFGPRFLHSTGQLHKGGPNTGVYIQVTADDGADVEIPGEPYSFSVLKQAQAEGDLHSLRDHGRRVIRLHLSGDIAVALSRCTDTVLHSTTGAR